MKCKICGKEFEPVSKRNVYCSRKCYYKSVMERSRGGDYKTFKPKICMNCGKEFTPKTKYQIFCSHDCYIDMSYFVQNTKNKLIRIADNNCFIVNNLSKIVKAKRLLFRHDSMMRCPCAANDKDRYCGSPKCIQEIKENGVCHCGLYRSALQNDKDEVK